ncbi:MAG: hypothetical protein HYX90_11590 [Chloroflexi bacterium]|nr:hypothetical protein [Chloroflexota bacterium]
MASRRRFFAGRGYLMPPDFEEPTQFRRIAQCFIRKEHTCGKYLGASTTCFIACPSTEEVKILIGLISEKLTKNRIDPVVATDIRAYGQDIFCTKICGRIIEAQFCIAILDDNPAGVKGKDLNVPNPNVYYEYGLMTALGKYVIPLQKEGQDLAFNIKTHDTIRYSPVDVSAEIDRALKEAIRITVEERESTLGEMIPEYMYRSFLAMKGYQKQGYSWLLSEELEGTVFSGYKNDRGLDYLFFTVIDSKEMLKTCLMDIQVIQRRLNTDCEALLHRLRSLDEKIVNYEKAVAEEETDKDKEGGRDRLLRWHFDARSGLSDSLAKRKEESNKLESIKSSKFGVVLNPDLVDLKEKCNAELDSMDVGPLKWPVYFGDVSGIRIGEVEVKFKGPEL